MRATYLPPRTLPVTPALKFLKSRKAPIRWYRRAESSFPRISNTFHSPRHQGSQDKKHEGEEAAGLHDETSCGSEGQRQASSFIFLLGGVAPTEFLWPLPAVIAPHRKLGEISNANTRETAVLFCPSQDREANSNCQGRNGREWLGRCHQAIKEAISVKG